MRSSPSLVPTCDDDDLGLQTASATEDWARQRATEVGQEQETGNRNVWPISENSNGQLWSGQNPWDDGAGIRGGQLI